MSQFNDGTKKLCTWCNRNLDCKFMNLDIMICNHCELNFDGRNRNEDILYDRCEICRITVKKSNFDRHNYSQSHRNKYSKLILNNNTKSNFKRYLN